MANCLKYWNDNESLWLLGGLLIGVFGVLFLKGLYLVIKWCTKKRETVEEVLKKHYGKSGKLTFYTTCTCVITNEQNEPRNSTSDEMLKDAFFKNNNDVLIIGEEGFGKTYLLQHILHQWSTGLILQDVILIYIKLDGLYRNSCILEEVVKSMKGQIHSAKAISSALRQKDALVLLDGVQNLPLEDNPQISNQRNSKPLTVESLLNKTYKTMFQNMKVWATFRPNVGDVSFETPNTSVNLDGFSETQRKTYRKHAYDIFKQICLKTSTYGDSIDESSVQTLLGESEMTKLMEASFENTYKQFERKVTRSPLLAHILLLEYLGEIYLPDIVCSLALCKHLKIADWCRKLERNDILFDKNNLYYSKDRMNDVCFSCKRLNVTLGTLTCCGDYPTYSNLPDIDGELKFENVELRKNDFFNLIQYYAGKSLSITFIKTDVPMTEQLIPFMNKEEFSSLTVCHEKGKKRYQWNFNTANWEDQQREERKTSEPKLESTQ